MRLWWALALKARMDIIIKFGLYFLGVITSLLLIPLVEKKKSAVKRKESLGELFVELDDIHIELIDHLKSNFQFLINLRTEGELVKNGKLPVPMPKLINTEVLGELYKASALSLTSPQRLAVKRIPNSINEIMRHTKLSVDSAVNERIYCVQSVKNTVKLSCYLLHEINFLREHRERFIFAKDLNSNNAVLPVLRSLGFNETQITISRIEESQFDDVKVKI